MPVVPRTIYRLGEYLDGELVFAKSCRGANLQDSRVDLATVTVMYSLFIYGSNPIVIKVNNAVDPIQQSGLVKKVIQASPVFFILWC